MGKKADIEQGFKSARRILESEYGLLSDDAWKGLCERHASDIHDCDACELDEEFGYFVDAVREFMDLARLTVPNPGESAAVRRTASRPGRKKGVEVGGYIRPFQRRTAMALTVAVTRAGVALVEWEYDKARLAAGLPRRKHWSFWRAMAKRYNEDFRAGMEPLDSESLRREYVQARRDLKIFANVLADREADSDVDSGEAARLMERPSFAAAINRFNLMLALHVVPPELRETAENLLTFWESEVEKERITADELFGNPFGRLSVVESERLCRELEAASSRAAKRTAAKVKDAATVSARRRKKADS